MPDLVPPGDRALNQPVLPAAPCRLVMDGPRPPALNMAVDELLLRECQRSARPVLRFYLWDPPGLSLGRFQRECGGVDAAFCRRAGIPVVRRLTGGRAVLHHREVTYSFSSPYVGVFAAGGLREAYAAIAGALAAGLAMLGVRAKVEGRTGGAARKTANCFLSPSEGELTWEGRKLVGSAQVRAREGFLQHGSVPLSLDDGLWGGVFPDGPPVGLGAASLSRVLGRDVDTGEVARVLAAGFASRLSLAMEETRLTADELDEAAEMSGKYLVPGR